VSKLFVKLSLVFLSLSAPHVAHAQVLGSSLNAELAALVQAYGQNHLNSLTGRANVINAEANHIRAQGDYYRLMGEARLLIARAQYTDALTQQVLVNVDFWREAVDRFELEMENMRKREYEYRNRAERIEANIRSARLMQVGGLVNRRTYRSYFLVLMNVDPDIGNEVIFKDVEAMDAEQFKANKPGLVNAKTFAGGSLQELLDFALENDLSLWRGRKAHKSVAEAYEGLINSVASVITDINSDLEALRDATMDDWEDIARIINIQPGALGGQQNGGGGQSNNF